MENNIIWRLDDKGVQVDPHNAAIAWGCILK